MNLESIVATAMLVFGIGTIAYCIYMFVVMARADVRPHRKGRGGVRAKKLSAK
ncbi:hypothetical protein [Chryseolinea lacunae]|uniref:MetS family NSS transporter small subunit n=1 Tax=Chryseolinea lacunae TaxID=2801331 RepID=A0ABS1KTM4_9BACT|nr:hypothetical protein [Chryseolinea lacunae]MBL0742729.1 hypothetical protein [Chryseolinea lacunae]